MNIQRLAELSIADILNRWPRTVDVFQRRRMACVGCALSGFYTPADAATFYGIAPEELLAELLDLIELEDVTHDEAAGI